ncbi:MULTISPECIES: nuclear transport factor 2 family protein [unclassified Streptomyces]|uniref:nuclear transport factor 2 family protein n=1 Tax=unclassified Streptomyces TaxID=2593676 RepID=UPI0033A4D971
MHSAARTPSESPDFATVLHELHARARIHDAILRFARGIDRCDRQLALSAFHADAAADYGSFAGNREEVVDWVIAQHREVTLTSHYISNEYVEIDGDTANAETYVQAIHRFERDGDLFELAGGGRYLDRFDLRDGDWRIAHRLVVIDRDRIDRVAETNQTDLTQKLRFGTRGPDDPGYDYVRRVPE